MEQVARKSVWCPELRRRGSYAQNDEVYKFGVSFSQHRQTEESINFLDRKRESLSKASCPILEILHMKKTDQKKLPDLHDRPRKKCSRDEQALNGFWKATNEKPLIRSVAESCAVTHNHHAMNKTLSSIFYRRPNPVEKNIEKRSPKVADRGRSRNRQKHNIKHNSVLSPDGNEFELSQNSFFKPLDFSKEVINSLYSTNHQNTTPQAEASPSGFAMGPNKENKEFNMSDLLKKMSRMTQTFYPKHTLMERNIQELQAQTAVSRYEIYSLFSAHNALLSDYRQTGTFDWESFKKGLAMILRVRPEFVEKVMLKRLGEIQQPAERVLQFKPFLKFVREVQEYNYQQRLIEFIDVIFDVKTTHASYEQMIAMFMQYKPRWEAEEHAESIFKKAHRQLQEDISKEQLKELCINDAEVFLLLNQLNKNGQKKDDSS